LKNGIPNEAIVLEWVGTIVLWDWKNGRSCTAQCKMLLFMRKPLW